MSAEFLCQGELKPRSVIRETLALGQGARPLSRVRGSSGHQRTHERGRRHAGEAGGLAGEVRLVGKPEFDGQASEIHAAVQCGEKPLEPQHPPQRARAVPDGEVKPAAKLSLAQCQCAGKLLDPCRRLGEHGDGPAEHAVRWPGKHEAGRDRRNAPPSRPVGKIVGQPGREIGPQVEEIHAQVAHFAERNAERRSPGAGPEPRAHQYRARRQRGRRRPRVRSGDVGTAAALPDQVRAAVGQHQRGRPALGRNDPRPQAGQRAAKAGRWGPFAVGHGESVARGCDRFVQDARPRLGEDERMSHPDIDAAERFLAANARVLDLRRFERLFRGGPPGPVRDAVAAYRNADGGFGHGLEPDGRAPATQPAAIALALGTLHETDAWDEELAAGACGWLQANAPAEGGATFVEPTIEGWPRAPWWQPEAGRPASLVSTGQIAGICHARGVRHPWLDRATKLMWSRIELVDDRARGLGPYDLRGVLAFLQDVPDRSRAEKAVESLAPALLDTVTLDPDARGEVHGPLNFAPNPDSVARRRFDAATIDAHLDRLARGQRDDGGWTFNWPAWSPAAEREWRGSVTVEALGVLRANGRLA